MLLKADVLSLCGKEHEAKSIRFHVWRDMKKRLKKDKGLLNNKEFLENFLRAAMYFESPLYFNKYMNIAKKILDRDSYTDIKLSYLLYCGEKDKIEFLVKRKGYSAKPWIKLVLSLWKYDKYSMNYLINRYSDRLPTRDKIEVLKFTGRINEAMEQAFKGLEKNRYDYLLYDHLKSSLWNTKIIFIWHLIMWKGEDIKRY